MYNTNKGEILSAKSGIQVPKFKSPAGPVTTVEEAQRYLDFIKEHPDADYADFTKQSSDNPYLAISDRLVGLAVSGITNGVSALKERAKLHRLKQYALRDAKETFNAPTVTTPDNISGTTSKLESLSDPLKSNLEVPGLKDTSSTIILLSGNSLRFGHPIFSINAAPERDIQAPETILAAESNLKTNTSKNSPPALGGDVPAVQKQAAQEVSSNVTTQFAPGSAEEALSLKVETPKLNTNYLAEESKAAMHLGEAPSITTTVTEGSPGSNLDLNLIQIKETNAGGSNDQDLLKGSGEGLATTGQIALGVGIAADLASGFLKEKNDYATGASSVNGNVRLAYDAVANSLMAYAPYGTIAGGAMKVLGLANDALGPSTDKFKADLETLSLVGGSYGGSVSNITEAEAAAGKKYGVLDGSKVRRWNKKIAEAKRLQGVMKTIALDASDAKQSLTILSQSNAFNYLYQLDGGYDLRYLRAAKEGVKLLYFKEPFKVNLTDISNFKVELTDTPTLLKAGGTLLDVLDESHTFKVVLTDISEAESFKKGGVIKDREIEVIETDTAQKSVIPEGALHKNKHHLDSVGVDDSELTKKGIPVVDNQGELLAEIELNEIIFTLEVTKELESRYKEFYEEGTSSTKKDELAIEAGKLLWKEILYNTDDRTGLIDTLKLGGALKLLEGGNSPKITLEQFISEKLKERTESAILKATTRKVGYKFKNPNWTNCIATATDNYGVPIVIRNSDLVSDPNKYGFEELQFNSIDDLPMGALILDYNKIKDVSTSGHTIMYVGLSDPDENGRSYPLYSYSSGRSIPEDMHNYALYKFMYWDDKVKPKAYRYIGTPQERSQWEEEYYSLHPELKPKHKNGGSLVLEDIDKMVKQAIINLLTQNA